MIAKKYVLDEKMFTNGLTMSFLLRVCDERASESVETYCTLEKRKKWCAAVNNESYADCLLGHKSTYYY